MMIYYVSGTEYLSGVLTLDQRGLWSPSNPGPVLEMRDFPNKTILYCYDVVGFPTIPTII